MAKMVADSSALILLAKCDLLEIVCRLYSVIIPTAVSNEVASEELVSSYPDAAFISNLIQEGKIRIQNPEKATLPISLSLHQGELDALSLAIELRRPLLATDDGKAIKAARFLKVPFTIAPKIVVELFRLGEIPFIRARDSLERLSTIGRYSPEIIADALVSLMEEKDDKANNGKDT